MGYSGRAIVERRTTEVPPDDNRAAMTYRAKIFDSTPSAAAVQAMGRGPGKGAGSPKPNPSGSPSAQLTSEGSWVSRTPEPAHSPRPPPPQTADWVLISREGADDDASSASVASSGVPAPFSSKDYDFRLVHRSGRALVQKTATTERGAQNLVRERERLQGLHRELAGEAPPPRITSATLALLGLHDPPSLERRHVIGLHPAGEGGESYLQLVGGETLADCEKLGPDELLAIGRDLARAVGGLHGRGWLHGDVRGSNVLSTLR